MMQELLTMYNKYGENENRFIEEYIVNSYENNINFFCKEYKSRPYYEDLKQEVRIAIIEAVRKYDLNNGAKFDTYAYTAIKNAIIRKHRCQYVVRVPEHIKLSDVNIAVYSNKIKSKKDEEYDVYDYTPNKCLNYVEFDINFKLSKTFLTSEEFNILKLLIAGYSKNEVGKIKNVAHQTIYNKFKSITNKLKGKYEEVI